MPEGVCVCVGAAAVVKALVSPHEIFLGNPWQAISITPWWQAPLLLFKPAWGLGLNEAGFGTPFCMHVAFSVTQKQPALNSSSSWGFNLSPTLLLSFHYHGTRMDGLGTAHKANRRHHTTRKVWVMRLVCCSWCLPPLEMIFLTWVCGPCRGLNELQRTSEPHEFAQIFHQCVNVARGFSKSLKHQ